MCDTKKAFNTANLMFEGRLRELSISNSYYSDKGMFDWWNYRKIFNDIYTLNYCFTIC